MSYFEPLWLAQTVNHLFFIHQEPHRDQYLTSTTFRFENIYCTQNNKYICIHVQIYYMTFVYYVIVSFFRGGRLFCFSLFRMTMKFWHLGCVNETVLWRKHAFCSLSHISIHDQKCCYNTSENQENTAVDTVGHHSILCVLHPAGLKHTIKI